MTDKEKIQHHDTISEIRQTIGSCFGVADGIFAGHFYDEKSAKEIRKLAEDNEISLNEILEIILGYLYRKGFIVEHINKEYGKAESFFSKKLK
ncbi:hypothetical protein [uncultured Chryseobacterium sp.]|uniref:hypothetical protein n=1 Tax=uncultured Chryseobacterium sp. TaxID=259322 RepID=UPI0025CF73FF|nr:hypothetical protein [uncultured Chryseobacterium sp.]